MSGSGLKNPGQGRAAGLAAGKAPRIGGRIEAVRPSSPAPHSRRMRPKPAET